jgi:hypothetical protein
MARFKPWTDKQYLYDMYIVKRKTITEIAEDCKSKGIPVTEMTIFNNLKKHDLLRNSRNLGSRSVGGDPTKKKKGFYQ